MNQYKVTLNFTFEEEYSVREDDFSPKTASAKKKAYKRTDDYYNDHSIIDHVKSNNALAFVESLFLDDGEILHAEWDRKKFQIHMVVNTTMTPEELVEDLKMTSLEDGEYEACGDTGWIVMTRGPNYEIFDGGGSMDDVWVYGFTDYRSNPIEVSLIGPVPTELPRLEEVIQITEKGREVYKTLADLKQKGIRLNEEDSLKFQVMKILLKDPRLYPVGVAL